jgi:hypothetical protein
MPTPGQVGCYLVRVSGTAEIDLPDWWREHIPAQVALTDELDRQFPSDPGWRLAALGVENDEATRALRDGIWWPRERGGIHVRLGDGFSGVGLSLEPTGNGFDGEARTFSDIGDSWFHTQVRLERVACQRSPTIIKRRGGF